jgi:glycerol-3-phosphate O-acyltransferase/dihydroxyacetone phosphate acyltransferase
MSEFNIHNMRERRAELSVEVTELINTLGPEMFDDFDKTRLVPDAFKVEGGGHRDSSSRRRRDSDQSATGGSYEVETPPALSRRSTTQSSRALPRNDSFSNIGHVGIFSTRPPSRNRSRSRSSSGGMGFPISGFTTLDSEGGFGEASKRIREAMTVRRRRSEKLGVGAEDSDDESGSEAEEDKKNE